MGFTVFYPARDAWRAGDLADCTGDMLPRGNIAFWRDFDDYTTFHYLIGFHQRDALSWNFHLPYLPLAVGFGSCTDTTGGYRCRDVLAAPLVAFDATCGSTHRCRGVLPRLGL